MDRGKEVKYKKPILLLDMIELLKLKYIYTQLESLQG